MTPELGQVEELPTPDDKPQYLLCYSWLDGYLSRRVEFADSAESATRRANVLLADEHLGDRIILARTICSFTNVRASKRARPDDAKAENKEAHP